ncbi:MAG: DNA polymerase III subunit alpha [Gemmatimonadetes bacterium]|nr:DNA polymerase III subunit alpha [Gemmatimonadota bacterium]
MSFCHLHCHSEYSLLDGANRIGDLITRAKEFEQPALALTDHGCMFGAWTFQEQAKKAGIKPIIGMEAYVAPNSRHDRGKVKGEKGYYHLVLLARDLQGYKNLTKLTSIGYTQGFYSKPRIDREVLAAHSEGLIVTSACLAGEVAQHLMEDRWEKAKEAAEWYANTFDGRYYLEVQGHDSPGQDRLNQQIFRLSEEVGLPIVATNDTHFLKSHDHEAHDVLLCIGLGKDFTDPNRMKYDRELYFKNHEEMRERFPNRPDVLENTLRIADEVDLSFAKKYYVPEFPRPEGVTASEAELLEQWVWEGAKERYGRESEARSEKSGDRSQESEAGPEREASRDLLPAEVVERIEYELSVINDPKLGYAGYFLITADFIRWAREHGIPVGPGRGSAAGSIVAFCTGITDICPLKFDLLFERFLNPERVSMPDIDVDFCFERRGEVIEYVRQKYGRDAVGQIITFGTMKSRAVVKDVGRTLGFLPAETDRLAKLIPNGPAYSLSVEEAIEKIPEVRELYEKEDRYRRLLDYSKTLEGLSRHSSVHAAGVVIAPGPLDEYVPICTQNTKGSGGGDNESIIVTQYDMTCLEKAGMLKMDFLGLKTLTVIHGAVETIRRRHGTLRHPDTGDEFARAEDIPLDDAPVYAMLSRGGTAGVFQFESALATEKLRAMKADRFDDLIATNALIRPGPLDMGMDQVYIRRKLGQEPVRYAHPELKETLEPTYGVIVYQEQVMRIAQILAGLSLAEADVLRKAVGKKDAKLIAAELGKFVSKAVEKGHDRRVIQDLADQIEAFGRYGFNKSHSAAYGLLSYQTAWLKCHYPAEFMAALMSTVVDKTDDVVAYIASCRDMGRSLPRVGRDGIQVLPPHVNESNLNFTVVGEGVGQIRFGLGAIRGVGEGAVRSILAAREAEGPFTSMFDLLTRIDLRLCNKRVLEALICAGALDGFAPEGRAQLMATLEVTFATAQDAQRERESSQENLFDSLLGDDGTGSVLIQAPALPQVDRWSEGDRLAREKEILGFFISGHPLDKFREDVTLFDRVNSANLREHRDQKVELACVVTAAARQISKRDGAEWGRITVEDFHGTATVLAFGDVWTKFKDVLQTDTPVLIRGGVSGRERDEEDPPIFLDAAVSLADLRENGEVTVCVELGGGDLDADGLRRAKLVLGQHPGPAPLVVVWSRAGNGSGNGERSGGGGEPPRFRSRSLRIAPREELLRQLREMLGEEKVRLVRV